LLKVLNERGHRITQPVLSSAVMRFATKGERFTRPKKGIYALINKSHAGAPSNGAGHRGFAKLVEEVLPSLPTHFTRVDIRIKVGEKYPERVAKVNGDMMRSTLYKLTQDGKIKVVKRAEGKEPTVYTALPKLGNQSAASESEPIQQHDSLTVLQKVRNVVNELPGDITQREVKNRLLVRYPALAKRKNFNATVSNMLKKLTDKKELQLARRGFGSEPHVYRKAL
jgi:hypothetical protein